MRVLARGTVLRLSSDEVRRTEMGKWSMRMDAELFVGVASTPGGCGETTAVLRLAATF
jgi:hypothetical protein